METHTTYCRYLKLRDLNAPNATAPVAFQAIPAKPAPLWRHLAIIRTTSSALYKTTTTLGRIEQVRSTNTNIQQQVQIYTQLVATIAKLPSN